MTIPNYPSFSGPGWGEKADQWIADNIPAQYASAIQSEAMIAWNRHGGRPSSAFCAVVSKLVHELNSGLEPTFPNVEFNQSFLTREG